MKVVDLDVEVIKVYPGNPRTPRAAVQKVKASITEFGFQQPLVVDRDHVIIVGHMRYQAARALGMTHVPTVVAGRLTELQAKAYRIADNRIGAETEFDTDRLAVELVELSRDHTDLATLGFNAAELSSLQKTPQDAQADRGLGSPVISYELIFASEGERAIWFDFLRWLKAEMPEETTIGHRLARFAEDGYVAGS